MAKKTATPKTQPTPTPIAPTDPFAAKTPKTNPAVPQIDATDPFSAQPKPATPKPAKTEPKELSLLEKLGAGAIRTTAARGNEIVSVGQAALNALLTTGRFSAGSNVENAKITKYREGLIANARKGKTGEAAMKAQIEAMNSPEYRFLKGTNFNTVKAGIENVDAGNKGAPTASYIDVLKTSNPEVDWDKTGIVEPKIPIGKIALGTSPLASGLTQLGGLLGNKDAAKVTKLIDAAQVPTIGKVSLPALAGDILTDPLSFAPAGTFLTPAKGAIAGAQQGVKGALAAAKGAPSTRYAIQNLTPKAAAKVKAKALPAKPGYSVFEQVTRKPVIKENLKTGVGPMAEVLKNTDELLRTKFTYTTSPSTPNLMKIIGSSLEAGYKGAANRIVLDLSKRSLQKLAREEGKQAAIIVGAKVLDEVGEEVELQPLVPHVADGQTFVVQDLKNGTKKLHTFDNEEEAVAFVNSLTKKPKTAKVEVTRGPEPIIDSMPKPSTIAPMVTPEGVSVRAQAQKLLKDVENTVKNVKGNSNTTGLIESIGKIVNRADGNVNIPDKARLILTQVVENGADGLAALRNITTKESADVARILNMRNITTANGKVYQLGQIAQSNFQWDNLAPSIQKQIIDAMRSVLAPASTTAKSKLAELTTLVGKDLANEIKKTGILEGKETKAGALAAVLSKLPPSGEKTYNNFEELVAGLKGGDIVDYKVLQKLANLIDPQNAATIKVTKALTKEDAYQQFKEILVQKGVQTMQETQSTINVLDASKFLESEGLSFADTFGVYTEDRLAGRLQPLPAAIPESRSAASINIARWMKDPNNLGTSGRLSRVLVAINEGLSGNFAYLQEQILNSAEAVTGVSTLGDLASRSTNKAFQAETKAALRGQVTQSAEARILSNLLGKIRYDLSVKGRKKASPIDVDPALIMDEFLKTGKMLDAALLSTTGARITYNKTAKAAQGEKHFVYASITNLAKIFNETGGRATFIDALIADTRKLGIKKTDSLSFVAVGNATRHILEQVERGIPVDVSEVVKILKSRGEQQTPWSPAFKKTYEQTAARFADHLTQPKVIKKLQEAHTARAAAEIEDNLASVKSVAQDVLEIMFKAWQKNSNKGNFSEAERAQLVRDYFNHFTYASGIFRIQEGEVAEAIFKAASMVFLRNGRLAKDGKIGTGSPLLGSPRRNATPEEQQIWKEMMEGIDNFYRFGKADNTPNVKLGTVTQPTEKQIGNATKKFTEAKLAFENHVNARAGITTQKALTEWEAQLKVVRANLERTRNAANKLGISTQHWDDGEWVPSTMYDHAGAVQRAQEATNNLVTTERGVVKAAAVDEPNLFPSHKILTAKQAEKLLETWRAENIKQSIDSVVGDQEEAAIGTLNKIGEFINQSVDDVEAAYRIYHETILGPYDKSQVRVHMGAVDYQTLEKTLTEGEVRPSMIGRTGERISATSGRWNTRPLMVRAESTLMNQVSHLADAAHTIRSFWMKQNVTSTEVYKAFNYVASKATPPARESARIKALTDDLKRLLDPIFGNPETTAIIANHLPPKTLESAFAKYGLTETLGFQAPSELLTPKQLSEYLQWMPFAKGPSKSVDADAYNLWKTRKKSFEDSGADPFIVLTKMAQAVQFAITEHTFVTDFASRFSAKAYGLTPEQAMKQGWVQIKGISHGGTDLTQYLPSPENGGLFHPQIADEFLSNAREWNKLFNDKKLSSKIQLMMEVVGTFKASQTVGIGIPNPRHHIVNIVGETTTALLKGVVNPVVWGHGIRLAYKLAGDDVKALIKSKQVDQKLIRSANAIEEPNKAFEAVTKDGVTGLPIKIRDKKTGKLVQVVLDDELLIERARNRGLAIGNTYQDDIQGLAEAVTARSLAGAQGTVNDSVLNLLKQAATGEQGAARQLGAKTAANVRQGVQAAIKPYGTLASWYTNVSRLAHMSDVISKRSWNSVEEALDAAMDEVSRYHPTLSSLSAAERVGPRLVFGYYTWIRVSHNALIDMAMNHTMAMLLFPRLQTNIAEMEGLNPASESSPWDPNAMTPEYLRAQVYGPTVKQDGDKYMFQRGLQTMDVLNFWSVWYQPWRTPAENAVTMSGQLGTQVGKNLNAVLQPLAESVANKDFQTGISKEDATPETVLDDFLGQLGVTALFRGLGAYTPINKEYTQEERDLILRNWLTGTKGTITNSDKNIKNAFRDANDRIKYLWENKRTDK